MSTQVQIKKDFPIFENASSKGKKLVYLDSAATSQKPNAVIQAEQEWYEHLNANIHRGAYDLAERATESIEKVRIQAAQFLNAKSPKSIVFTRGTTEGINMIVNGWARHYLKKGDTVLLTEMEHHANIIPWQLLAQEIGIKLRFWPIDEHGELVSIDFDNSEIKLISLAHVSNVLGTINPVLGIIKQARQKNIPVIIDGAQAAPHMKLDMQVLCPDFYVCSSHKMLGPTGVGMVYINPDRFQEMHPYQGGGEMIQQVDWESSTYKPVPWRMEAGTLPLAQIYGFGAALHYLQNIGMEKVQAHDQKLVAYAYEQLLTITEIIVHGPAPQKRSGLIAFTVKDIHPHDLATLLNEKGIAVRAGHHCAMPLHKKLNIPASARASFYLYNDKSDVDYLVEGLQEVIAEWKASAIM